MTTTSDQLICPNHVEEIKYVDLRQHIYSGERTKCRQCSLTNPVLVEKVIEDWQGLKWKEIESKSDECQQYVHQLDLLLKALENLKKSFESEIGVIEEMLLNNKRKVQEDLHAIMSKINSFDDPMTTSKLQKIAEILSYKSSICNESIQYFFTPNYITTIKESITRWKFSICQLKNLNHVLTTTYNKFNQNQYQIQNTFEQQNPCFAVDINYDNSIVASSCEKYVIIWKLQDGNLKFKQKLEGHNDDIVCLKFNNKFNILISGGWDETVKIWFQTDSTCWELKKTLKISSDISSLVFSDNQILAATNNGKIEVWQRSFYGFQDCERMDILDKHNGKKIYCLGLNQTGDQMVSSGDDNKILIWIFSGSWQLTYSISCQAAVFRVSYMGDNQIACQSTAGFTQILDQINRKFVPTTKLELNNETVDYPYFSSRFSEEKSILLEKHNKYIYLIKRCTKTDFRILKEFECNSISISGAMTSDGKYLIYYDMQSKKFRSLKI